MIKIIEKEYFVPKIGDKVRVIEKNPYCNRYGWEGEIFRFHSGLWYVRFHCGDERCYSASEIIKIEESTMTPKEEEIKLEVGKKYIIKNAPSNPYIYLADKREIGIQSIKPFVFIDKDKSPANFGDLRTIEKCHEPYKNSMERWLVCKKEEKANFSYWIDELFNLNTDGELYRSEVKALDNCNMDHEEIKKVKITIEY
jgi:hypothetical protein